MRPVQFPKRGNQVLGHAHGVRCNLLAELLHDRLQGEHHLFRLDLVHQREELVQELGQDGPNLGDVIRRLHERPERHDGVNLHRQVRILEAVHHTREQRHEILRVRKLDFGVHTRAPRSLGPDVTVRGLEGGEHVRREHWLELFHVPRGGLELLLERPDAVERTGELGVRCVGAQLVAPGEYLHDEPHELGHVLLCAAPANLHEKVDGGGSGRVHLLDDVVTPADVLLRVLLPQLGVHLVKTHDLKHHVEHEGLHVGLHELVRVAVRQRGREVLEGQVYDSVRQVATAGKRGQQLHVRLEEHARYLLLERLGELLVLGLDLLGVAVPAEQTVGDVQAPFLRLPPREVLSLGPVARLSLGGHLHADDLVETRDPRAEHVRAHQRGWEIQVGGVPVRLQYELHQRGQRLVLPLRLVGDERLEHLEQPREGVLDDGGENLPLVLVFEFVLAADDLDDLHGAVHARDVVGA